MLKFFKEDDKFGRSAYLTGLVSSPQPQTLKLPLHFFRPTYTNSNRHTYLITLSLSPPSRAPILFQAPPSEDGSSPHTASSAEPIRPALQNPPNAEEKETSGGPRPSAAMTRIRCLTSDEPLITRTLLPTGSVTPRYYVSKHDSFFSVFADSRN